MGIPSTIIWTSYCLPYILFLLFSAPAPCNTFFLFSRFTEIRFTITHTAKNLKRKISYISENYHYSHTLYYEIKKGQIWACLSSLLWNKCHKWDPNDIFWKIPVINATTTTIFVLKQGQKLGNEGPSTPFNG